MLVMYHGYQLVPVKSGESWQVKIFSGGKLISATILFATEDTDHGGGKKGCRRVSGC
jgi:hypothetical protein